MFSGLFCIGATIVHLLRLACIALTVTVFCCVPCALAGSPAHPLQTGFNLSTFGSGSDTSLAFARARAAGTTVVRLNVTWDSVAPTSPPDGFEARNPNDPSYNWSKIDGLVRQAVLHHLQPLVTIYDAPVWAEKGPGDLSSGALRVDPAAFGDFARAAATRFDGAHGLPWVRYWQAWNEPNITLMLSPQFVDGQAVAPALYRSMLNAFAPAVHSAHRGNVVVAAGLSPFTLKAGSIVTNGPMRFMRDLLCMSRGARPKPTCATRVVFDVWDHHPYTSGNAMHKATNPDDVSLGDLPKMSALLDAAYRAGHIVSPTRPAFWVTEWSWDSNPPDPAGVPLALDARWTAEALYQMWLGGVDWAMWLSLRDQPYPASPYQGGLYSLGPGGLATDKPKPGLTAFTFPFVAYIRGAGVYVWARTPWGRPANVVVERRRGSAWQRLAVIRTDRYGVASSTIQGTFAKSDLLRAHIASARSLSFSLTQPPDRLVNPFGS
jgi:hypothetical protein